MIRALFASMFPSVLQASPMPWSAETKDTAVYIYDAKGRPVARVFGTLRDARATAEMICAACQDFRRG